MQALSFHFFKDRVEVKVLPVHLRVQRKKGSFPFSAQLDSIGIDVLLGKMKVAVILFWCILCIIAEQIYSSVDCLTETH